MANPTSLKVLNSNGVEEVLQVGDKVKYRIHYDYRSSRAVDTVVLSLKPEHIFKMAVILPKMV